MTSTTTWNSVEKYLDISCVYLLPQLSPQWAQSILYDNQSISQLLVMPLLHKVLVLGLQMTFTNVRTHTHTQTHTHTHTHTHTNANNAHTYALRFRLRYSVIDDCYYLHWDSAVCPPLAKITGLTNGVHFISGVTRYSDDSSGQVRSHTILSPMYYILIWPLLHLLWADCLLQCRSSLNPVSFLFGSRY